jgi:uncharacterized protein YdaT
MPWTDRDASKKTKKATSPKSKRQWRHVANAVLEKTGDEGRAVRAANSVVKKSKGRKKTRKSSR